MRVQRMTSERQVLYIGIIVALFYGMHELEEVIYSLWLKQ